MKTDTACQYMTLPAMLGALIVNVFSNALVANAAWAAALLALALAVWSLARPRPLANQPA